MKQKFNSVVFVSSIISTSIFLLSAKAVTASVLHKDWIYTLDAYNDASPFDSSGNSEYEIFGSAYQVANEKITIAINANFSFDGIANNLASGGKVDFGDILLNFTGENLEAANGELFGIHFIENNDSGITELGVYSQVTAREVATINNGFENLEHYNDTILAENVTPKNGEFAYDDPYFNQATNIFNVIESGTKIGDIQLFKDATSLGLDFEHFGASGSELFAIQFAESLLPKELGIYHFAPECDNDIVAGYINAEPVPTPTAILPVLLGFAKAVWRKKARKISNNY
ncbi:MAG: PTPA-CTERM sorting domain-containing protein [Limnothrix sp.]